MTTLEHFPAEQDQTEIDRQFAAMIDDSAYQALNLELDEAFAVSDWEAWQRRELANL